MSNVKETVDFSIIRYAQCWEDADILLSALDVKRGGHYISIASGGENSFSICSFGAKVTAIDLNFSQLCCTALKQAAYKLLTYDEFLSFVGVTNSTERLSTYARLKSVLDDKYAAYWDQNFDKIETGILHIGKFEDYFKLFRGKVLPFIHTKSKIDKLLLGNENKEKRTEFFEKEWENFRWNALFNLFFSKRVMGKKGRDPEFFQYVEGSVANRIKARVKLGLIHVNPAENPYLHYILKGNYGSVLPHALRRENFDKVKQNCDKIELVLAPIEEFLESTEDESISGYNLSDIFEYMTIDQMDDLYQVLLKKAKPNARIVYWNMLAKRSYNESLFAGRAQRNEQLSKELFEQDKAFFYSRFLVEEKI